MSAIWSFKFYFIYKKNEIFHIFRYFDDFNLFTISAS